MRSPTTLFQLGALLMAVVSFEGEAMSHQKDPRLDALFTKLAAARNAEEAATAEQQIWSIWFDVGDERGNVLMQQGSEALDRGDARAALAAFDALIEARPDFAEGWNRRATVYFLMGRFAESVADIERTLALEPRHFGALSGLSMIREAQNQPFAALEALETVSRIHPRMPHLYERVNSLTAMLGQAI